MSAPPWREKDAAPLTLLHDTGLQVSEGPLRPGSNVKVGQMEARARSLATVVPYTEAAAERGGAPAPAADALKQREAEGNDQPGKANPDDGDHAGQPQPDANGGLPPLAQDLAGNLRHVRTGLIPVRADLPQLTGEDETMMTSPPGARRSARSSLSPSAPPARGTKTGRHRRPNSRRRPSRLRRRSAARNFDAIDAETKPPPLPGC